MKYAARLENEKRTERMPIEKRPLAAIFLLALALPAHAHEHSSGRPRTVKVKIAVDEEFRRRPLQFLETRKWLAAASHFFEKNFGVAFHIEELKYWSSDNSKRTLSALFQSLYEEVDKDDVDIVLGFTAQVRGESDVGGVASYLHGYALVKRLRSEYMMRVTLIHELCHLFGAVDLEEEPSIMNKDEPTLECDEFTGRVVRLHINRRFDQTVFPLSAGDMGTAMFLYLERKRQNRGEAGVSIMLAIFYLATKDYEKAIQECLEAERIEPDEPGIKRLLALARQRK